jgi:hypothetical protein
VNGTRLRWTVGLGAMWVCAASLLAQGIPPAVGAGAGVPPPPATAPGAAQQAERARLAAQREAITARFLAEEQACRDRFVVTACVDEVRVRRREALEPVRQRELQLGDADRRARAAERQAALAEKQRAARQRVEVPPAAEVRLRNAPSPGASAPRPTGRPAPRKEDPAARAGEAADRMKARQERDQASQDAQERVRKRRDDRAASGRAAAPLPPPDRPGSSAGP